MADFNNLPDIDVAAATFRAAYASLLALKVNSNPSTPDTAAAARAIAQWANLVDGAVAVIQERLAEASVDGVARVGDRRVYSVSGNPEGSQVGSPGDIALSDGGSLHFKASGSASDTGWARVSAEGTHLELPEQASMSDPSAGDGRYWVHDDTPNTPWFTDDAGSDHRLAYQSALPSPGGAPANVTKAAASAGSSVDYARQDHKHDISTSAAVALALGGSNQEGSASTLARSDHEHSLAVGSPSEISDSTNSAGVGTRVVRNDHVHAHGDRGGGSLHAAATTSVAGFLSAADKTKLESLVDIAFIYGNDFFLPSGSPATLAAVSNAGLIAEFSNDVTDRVMARFRVPSWYASTGFRFQLYMRKTANTGALNAYFGLAATDPSTEVVVPTPSNHTAVAVSNASITTVTLDLTHAQAGSPAVGAHVVIVVERLGAHTSDSETATVRLVGIGVEVQ
jgi:hypothetical protein